MSGRRRYLLDTNAIVALLRGNKRLTNLLSRADWLGISVISQIEFLAFPDISAEDVVLFEAFMARVDVMDIRHEDLALIGRAIELRRKHSIKLPDALITASALICNAQLLTGDRKLLNLAEEIDGMGVVDLEED